METPMTILFDGCCNLCSWAVKFIVARDRQGKFNYSALQSMKGQFILDQFNLSADAVNSVVFVQGDQYYTKSTAVLHILSALGGWPKLLTVFAIIPRPVRDLIYDIIARTRYALFGRRNACKRA